MHWGKKVKTRTTGLICHNLEQSTSGKKRMEDDKHADQNRKWPGSKGYRGTKLV